jgi:hypothetical protein
MEEVWRIYMREKEQGKKFGEDRVDVRAYNLNYFPFFPYFLFLNIFLFFFFSKSCILLFVWSKMSQKTLKNSNETPQRCNKLLGGQTGTTLERAVCGPELSLYRSMKNKPSGISRMPPCSWAVRGPHGGPYDLWTSYFHCIQLVHFFFLV